MQASRRSTVALVELASRLAPYMKGSSVPRSALERCLDALNFGPDGRDEAVQALTQARITIVEDLTDLPRPPSPTQTPSQRPGPRSTTQISRPVDPLTAARQRLARDAHLNDSRLARVLLKAEEEIGLTLLVRPDGQPMKAGALAALEGEARRAADALVLHNLGLVHSICQKYSGQGLEYEDLVQSAVPGLMRAIEMFDPAAGFKFSTYATQWIRQAVSRAIANQARAIRLPVHMWELVRRVVATREQMLREDRRPTPWSIAKELDISAEKVFECLKLAPGVVSLETPLGDDQFTLGDLVDAQADRSEHVEVDGLFPEDVEALLDFLPTREADILRMRYGIDSLEDPMTLDEIGQVLGVTRERIRQIEAKALRMIRMLLVAEGHTFRHIDPKTGKPPKTKETAASLEQAAS